MKKIVKLHTIVIKNAFTSKKYKIFYQNFNNFLTVIIFTCNESPT